MYIGVGQQMFQLALTARILNIGSGTNKDWGINWNL